MLSIERKGKFGGPKNFQNSAVRTPSRANAPSTKVTTGSRTRSKRNNGKRMPCQPTHRVHLARSAVVVGLLSVTGIEPGIVMAGPFAPTCSYPPSLDSAGDHLFVHFSA